MRIQQGAYPRVANSQPTSPKVPQSEDTVLASSSKGLEKLQALCSENPHLGTLLETEESWDENKRALFERALKALPDELLNTLGLTLHNEDDVEADKTPLGENMANREVLRSLLKTSCVNTLENEQLDRALHHLQQLFKTLSTADENDVELFFDTLTPEQLQVSQQAGLPGLAPLCAGARGKRSEQHRKSYQY